MVSKKGVLFIFPTALTHTQQESDKRKNRGESEREVARCGAHFNLRSIISHLPDSNPTLIVRPFFGARKEKTLTVVAVRRLGVRSLTSSSMKVYFVTGNERKLEEVKAILVNERQCFSVHYGAIQ